MPRNDCTFKSVNNKCRYPKLVRICCLCRNYLPHHGKIEKDLPYISFVELKKHNSNTVMISLFAVLISILLFISTFARLMFERKGDIINFIYSLFKGNN